MDTTIIIRDTGSTGAISSVSSAGRATHSRLRSLGMLLFSHAHLKCCVLYAPLPPPRSILPPTLTT